MVVFLSSFCVLKNKLITVFGVYQTNNFQQHKNLQQTTLKTCRFKDETFSIFSVARHG